MAPRHVQKLLEFLRAHSRFEKSPSFSAVLGVTSGSVSASQISFKDQNNGLTFRLPLTQRIRLPKQEKVSLSTYLAIIDDVTTWALVLGDSKRSRPGVSVSLRSEWGPAARTVGRRVGDEVEVITSVNKIGQNIGFVSAEVRDVATGGLVVSASHVKSLSLGLFVDFMMSSMMWSVTKLVTEHVLSAPEVEASPMSDIFDSLQFVSDNRATFEPSVTHASPGGPIHGGCQAVLMELVATQVAQRELGSSAVRLDSIYVEYMTSPKSKTVEIDVQTIAKEDADPSIRFRVQILGGGRLNSEGILHFTPEHEPATMQSKL